MGYNQLSPQTIAKVEASDKQNKSIRQLAVELNITKYSVHQCLAAAREPAATVKVGRPSIASAEQKRAIRAKALRSGSGTRKLAEWAEQRGYSKISKGTVASILKGGRAPLAFKAVKSGRVLSEKNRKLRLQFVKKHVKIDWDKVVFIDQKEKYMGYDEALGFSMRWQREDSRHIFKKSTNPKKFVFYAAVAKGHKSDLVSVPLGEEGKGRGTAGFDSVKFIKVFEQLWEEVKRWFPDGKFWVVMDSAKQHTSSYSKSSLAAMGVPLLKGFPPQSYDMNLIEVIWGQLEQKLLGKRHTKKKEYEKEIRGAWEEVKQTTIDRLVAKHPQQLKRIKEAQGSWVNYK
jgi:hypothetical protein